ncbi:LuxR family transcriptional regulator [Streptomyces piniterrae]|uniref:LuxR family transcriptional regulator n=1 Tax=Streptomyces piniterrae TaxID=2571125 RepID=A0A4U0NS35_9ACTN|nr:LuxR C-terminal-related transcriptional regulator [Streptomyces piniterrae]TJZ57260.1 LuxR family transcriptional regulator [Streptomyces piniterrae]
MGGNVRGAGTLPVEMTRFIGRRHELSQARTLLSRGRLVTLTGPGGIGKTRLALRVAAEVQRSFPRGVWLVELAALEDGNRLTQTVAARLRLGNEAIGDPLARLVDHVAGERMLLVLDNCEHVLDASAALVATLLTAAPDLQVLATSRQTLGVAGEQVLPVPSMVLSGNGGPSPELCDAVALFADRAAAMRPDFALTGENTSVIHEICRRLDGVPLAIELAAARLRALSAQEILLRLDDRFTLLTAGSRAALPRQQTLRAAIDWSHDLCTDQERLLWSRLSVFSDGFDLPAAERVCSGDGIRQRDVLDLVIGLVDKSVLAGEERGARMRYWLPDTLRQYGRERLAASGEEQKLRERHRDHYRAVAEQAEAEWFGPDQLAWFTRLRAEHPNLQAALEFSLGEHGQGREAMGLAASMWIHRLGFGSFDEGRQWLGRALAIDEEPSPQRAKALFVDGLLAVLQGDISAADSRVQQFRVLESALGEDPDLIRARVTLAGLVALFQGAFGQAVPLLAEALTRHQAAEDAGNAAVTSFMLSTACPDPDDPAGTVHAERCLALCEAHDAQWSRTHALWVLGLDHYRHGRHRRAGTLVRHALKDKPLSHDQWGVAQCLEVLGWCASSADRAERAATLLGAADATWRVAGSALTGLGHLQAGHQQCEAALRSELGDTAYAAAVEAGGRLTLEQSVAYALEESSAPTPPPPADEASAPLTRRERQVAGLVAQGMTNKEIAAELTISRRTAEGHVEHILTKLGFTSRAQIAAWAARNHGSDAHDSAPTAP